MNSKEVRTFTGDVEFRKKEEGSNLAGGYAAKFNVMSEDLGGFREIIMPGAFDDVLENDVRVLFNHDQNMLLARTASGTARVFQDETGLGYDFDLPNTNAGRDLSELLERGDVNQSSFAFSLMAGEDKWIEKEDGTIIREIHKVSRLYDVSPVTTPAYPDATVAKRSLEVMQENKKAADKDFRADVDHANARLQLLKVREQS